MDLYPIVCYKTKIENNPYFQVDLKDDVDPLKLYKAVSAAIDSFLLFGCTIIIKDIILKQTKMILC